LQNAKYFGLIINYITDIIHTGQLTIVMRYVIIIDNQLNFFLKFHNLEVLFLYFLRYSAYSLNLIDVIQLRLRL